MNKSTTKIVSVTVAIMIAILLIFSAGIYTGAKLQQFIESKTQSAATEMITTLKIDQ